jgi:DNA-binding SARP family transcriptional activator
MEYLVAAGRPHEALRAYEECRRALHAEVEADPSPEITSLRDQIQKGTYARSGVSASVKP